MLQLFLTLLFGSIAFWWGMRLGRVLLRQGVTANDLFKGRTSLFLAFLGFYIGLLLLALHVPQWQSFPLEWRVSGMRITWTLMRVMLLGFCGLAFAVSWRTARMQIVAIGLLGVLGLGGFTAAEQYFLAPIHANLSDNLQPNGVFRQSSNSSCAPAAMATLLRLWGIDATESSVARSAGTSLLGTSMPQLVVAARDVGLEAIELSPTWEQMQQINRPGVLATWLLSAANGRGPHAVALLAINDRFATIADPAFGKIFQVSQPQFDRIWRQQYLPLFRPTEATLTTAQVNRYLHELGYLAQATGVSQDAIEAAVRQFQQAIGVKATGKLDPETVLLLSGPFLSGIPTLGN